jgi:hypothetical protein
MTLNLLPSIALYLSAANQNATQRVKDCFTEDATVKDEGKTFRGVAEIQQWMSDTKTKYRHTIEPLAVRQEGQSTIVTSRLTGIFPGSPIEVPFKFALRNSKIARLEIG